MEDFHPEYEGSRFLPNTGTCLPMTSYPRSEFDSHHHDSLKSAHLTAELKPCFTLMANLKILFQGSNIFKI